MNFTDPVIPNAHDGEVWRWCVGYEGRYSVSNHGRVASHIFNRIRVLEPGRSDNGYKMVKLSDGEVGKRVTVHRLVATHFLPAREWEINHKDGNKLNNNVENLEWVTTSENALHAHKLGLSHVTGYPGELNRFSKLTEKQAINIRHCKGAVDCRSLGKLYSVSKTAVLDIWNGKTWGYLW